MSQIGWFEIIIILIFFYVLFPCWIYVIFKMAVMGALEGLMTTIKKSKGEMEQ